MPTCVMKFEEEKINLNEELEAVEEFCRRHCLTTHAVHVFDYSGVAVLDVLGYKFGTLTGDSQTVTVVNVLIDR